MATVFSLVFKGSDSAAPLKKSSREQLHVKMGTLLHQMNQLRGQIQAARITTVKAKLEKNAQNLESHVAQIISVSSKNHITFPKENGCGRMLLLKMEHPLCKFTGFGQGAGQKDSINCQEVVTSTCIILPYIDRLPTCTTWIFLERNQRMTEDQSVVGRRQIYYDQHGNEALICSDSEDEVADPEEGKHDFSEGDDRILWSTLQEHGIDDEILNIVNQFIGASISEIQERYNLLKEKNSGKVDLDSNKFETDKGLSLEKTLSAALDSFDNLFCRRCLLFDCRLHGCSQAIIYPNEKQMYCSGHEEDRQPCSDQCYLRSIVTKDLPPTIMEDFNGTANDTSDGTDCGPSTCNAEKPSANVVTDILGDETNISREMIPVTSEDFHSSDIPKSFDTCVFTSHHNEAIGKRKPIDGANPEINCPLLPSDDVPVCKKQKNILACDVINAIEKDVLVQDFVSIEDNDHEETGGPEESEFQRTTLIVEDETDERASKKFSHSVVASSDESHITRGYEPSGVIERPDSKLISDAIGHQLEEMSGSSEWKPMEKELYLKGIEIFGRNSCLITRNLLSGLKTCMEVFSYMRDGRASTPNRSELTPSLLTENDGRAGIEHLLEMPPRSRILRRKGKTRKLKYSWKSAGHPSVWKKIADGKNQSCKQYTPCGCLSMCGKQCPCLHNGSCCEKYCGCSKSCKNRFRGCHCAKSQCRSRQCPCFAAGRECDPDVCRNCWVSCGDGSLGKPPGQGDSQCGNMRLLLRQKQRILLAKSDVAGWGAFLKNSVNKNDYLGEYTGELISHREADKRGKIYDRANSSFLFDLNDQYVLDAYRKGDKLKFANHSSNPNCYAKVMLVAGDHRVGIFAKENIDASEELFYDYRYGPDEAPAWARKPGGSKRDDGSAPQGRAKKHQSH